MDDELYKLARERIDRRNRQMFLLGADVVAFFIYLAAYAAFSIIPRGTGVFIAIAWMGLLAFHMMIATSLSNRSDQIESEVERLRRAVYDEKPKREDTSSRLELTDDGELIDAPAWDDAMRSNHE